MPWVFKRGERLGHVVDRERDVPVARAELVRAPVVVERELEHRFLVADPEEVVRRLELALADDVHVALEREAERLVERAALLGIRDPDHRVQELRHAVEATGLRRRTTRSPAAAAAACRRRPVPSATPPRISASPPSAAAPNRSPRKIAP